MQLIVKKAIWKLFADILTGIWCLAADGLICVKLRRHPVKGLCVYIMSAVPANCTVMEYLGELVDEEEAESREQNYGESAGCYMYYFKFGSRWYCIDATRVPYVGSLQYGYARYCSHNRTLPTLKGKLIKDKQRQPHIVLVSTQSLSPGTELTFDYGDRDNVQKFPWLKD
jgi:[histone H4]-lysine20 N-methyltransferase SETD8